MLIYPVLAVIVLTCKFTVKCAAAAVYSIRAGRRGSIMSEL
jgi:hypothetical protein